MVVDKKRFLSLEEIEKARNYHVPCTLFHVYIIRSILMDPSVLFATFRHRI